MTYALQIFTAFLGHISRQQAIQPFSAHSDFRYYLIFGAQNYGLPLSAVRLLGVYIWHLALFLREMRYVIFLPQHL